MAIAIPSFGPQRKRWSVEDYQRLCNMAAFGPDERVELLEGEIVEKMGQNPPHVAGVRALAAALRIVFGNGFDVSQQLPIATPDSVPEPDVLVVRGNWRDYISRYPQADEVILVGEVADHSRLMHDREIKLRIYAHAGFAEYWIVNLVDRRLEVYRRPQPDGLFGDVTFFAPGESVSPLGSPGGLLNVVDLLP